MKGGGRRGRPTGEAHSLSLMETSTKASGRRTDMKVRGPIPTQTGKRMRESGEETSSIGRGRLSGLMGVGTKESTSKERERDGECGRVEREWSKKESGERTN